ncbi:tetratricopeptide repeat protein (macronuclear) [Tetrahymena thermophila SB210]|uniref:Tetratricopeptide repeat protein n=1 Tax=Tetrahymena thermophila (strain SB210) TaxID=312017 RepID=Q23EE4_TETTS|nr:tetratricopeptide repeat protein [Tetrahymena thermophila SB210]EAR94913.3 tetratricopeptide repeat protein [Tetrahymena thermophila SB210]|eukprot:XP_001015158.3 tetratricopeptide repeat protein [Tetrahymena thermophila SB210]
MNGADGHFNLIMVQRNLYFNNGLKLMSEGDFAGAQLYFKKILQNISGDLQAQFQLARCYQFCENYQAALLAYEDVFKRNMKDPRPVYQQAYIHEKNYQLDLAIKYYEKAAKILQNNISEFKNDNKIYIIYFTLGLKYEQKNEIEKAKQAFQTFIQFKNISDKARQLANKKLIDLANKYLEGSQTQQYKSKMNQVVRQQQQHPSYIKYQQSMKEEEEKNKAYNMVMQLEIAKSSNLYQLNLQQIKEDSENKKEQRKPGDSNISSQTSTADKHPSINQAQNHVDDNSFNFKINSQQDFKFITTNYNQLNINNISLPHQNNINTTTHNNNNNIAQNTHQQKNFPPQQIQSNSKINSTNQQNSSHQQQQQNQNNANQIKYQQFQQIQQIIITSDKLMQPSQSQSQDINGAKNFVNFPHTSADIKEIYQQRKNRLTFDPSSSTKDMFASNNSQNTQQQNAQNNQKNNLDQNILYEDDYEEILNEEDMIPDEKDIKKKKSSYKYLHPIEDDQEESDDDDIPSEKEGKTMQNKSSFTNPNQIKNIFMKSFIDVAQKSNSKSRISGQSHLSNSRFSVLQDQSALLKKNNVS